MNWVQLILFSFWLSSFTPSERVALGSAFLVLVGVIGEEVAELRFLEGKKQERAKRLLKQFAIGVLVIGLAGDLIGVVMGQAEMVAITNEAGDAKKSAERANEYANGIARLSWPRQLDGSKFVTLLRSKPKARIQLLYNPNDSEAWSFARDIYWWLGKGVGNHEGAGWNVSFPEPITIGAVNKRLSSPGAPIGMQFSGAYTGFGLTLRSRNTNVPSIPPLSAADCSAPISRDCLFFAKDALTQAILLSVLPDERGGALEAEQDDSMPNDLIVVIVGPKPPVWHLEKPTQRNANSTPSAAR